MKKNIYVIILFLSFLMYLIYPDNALNFKEYDNITSEELHILELNGFDLHGQSRIFLQTPLHHMLMNNKNDKAVMFLISKTRNINIKDSDLCTPLLLSIIYNRNFALIKAIIEKGANINDISFEGTSVLMWAIEKKRENKIIKYLINNGADVYYKNKKGKTVLDYAIEKENHEIIRLIKDKIRNNLTEMR